ncbi:NAD(P)-binding protein [Pseudomonas sp. MM211]|uniref:NAD(P)-binding protein n=1 Tax=Pseudomonas sp. MM211 TaxID=2866808 RepID=UPI001CECA3D9|nr:NAD(P)-binding protein [Pseudomonas sp. MM211]UCJ14699.1 NAD(P)-binding protein [Pseudomonas sp. MM211]
MSFVIIGGGLAGLLIAKRLLELEPGKTITILERNKRIGGLLAGTDYPEESLYFDQGTHLFRESEWPEVDEFLLGVLQPQQLLHFPPGVGDLAGSVFGGALQEHSHYPDIRSQPDHVPILDSVLDHLATGFCSIDSIPRRGSLVEAGYKRFGKRYTDQVLAPVLANMYGCSADELAGFAMLLPGLTRLVAMEQGAWVQRLDDAGFRALLAVPDQRRMPSSHANEKRRYYARGQGTRSFIEAIRVHLEQRGVNILEDVQITRCDPLNRHVQWRDAEGNEHALFADKLFFATGVVGAARILGIDIARFGFERPLAHRIVNIELMDATTSDLSYFYGLDPGLDFYRTTNYRAFSGDLEDRRLSIEVLGDRGIDDERLPQHLVDQLHAIGFLRNNTVRFARVELLSMGLPRPTMANLNALHELNSFLQGALPETTPIFGVGVGDGLFFQNEIMGDIQCRMGRWAEARS